MLFSVNPIVFDYHLLFVLCFAQGLALVWRILNFTRIQFGFHTLHISQRIRGLVIGAARLGPAAARLGGPGAGPAV